ncbi:MAG: hypothetical protein JWL99_2870 [Streptomyces oryziradicis]|nr:hypothetical protein [Actinacidiphila oryziradicis]
MDQAAAAEAGRAYKKRLLEMLGLKPGHTALDVGCGPGTDPGDLAVGGGETGPSSESTGIRRCSPKRGAWPIALGSRCVAATPAPYPWRITVSTGHASTAS